MYAFVYFFCFFSYVGSFLSCSTEFIHSFIHSFLSCSNDFKLYFFFLDLNGLYENLVFDNTKWCYMINVDSTYGTMLLLTIVVAATAAVCCFYTWLFCYAVMSVIWGYDGF